MPRPRVLFGGSFDPPTLAHRRVLEIGQRAVPGAEVVVVVAGSPPHKTGRRLTAATLRVALARLAFQDLPGVRVSDEECARDGVSYTVETLARHRADLGTGDLYWLIGSDSLLDFATWREHQRILSLARVLTVPRPGFDVTRLDAVAGLSAAERARLREGILAASGPSISATLARARIRRGEDARDLVNERILAFAAAHRLYRGTEA